MREKRKAIKERGMLTYGTIAAQDSLQIAVVDVEEEHATGRHGEWEGKWKNGDGRGLRKMAEGIDGRRWGLAWRG